MSDISRFGLRGFLIDAPEFGALRAWPNGAVLVDNGRIADIGDYDDVRRKHPPNSIHWIEHRSVAIFPGLIDCHTHLPQYSAVAPQFFRELARNGTTTVMAYAAIYEDSCDIGFEAARRSGVRTILGKMMMDLGSYGQIQPKKVLS